MPWGHWGPEGQETPVACCWMGAQRNSLQIHGAELQGSARSTLLPELQAGRTRKAPQHSFGAAWLHFILGSRNVA